MVIKNINMPEQDFRQLMEEQMLGNIKYKIYYSYAPKLGFVSTKIGVSIINENDANLPYEKEKGLTFSDDKLCSYDIEHDKKGSSTMGNFTSEPLKYYDYIISLFDELISSNNCEFTKDALEIYDNVKNTKINTNGDKACNIK